MVDFLPFLVILMVLAALFREHTILTVFYLLAGAYILGRWWTHRVLSQLHLQRNFMRRAFLNQAVTVELEIKNNSWLPLAWLQIHESLPVSLISPNFYRQVASLGSHSLTRLSYTLIANKRGYYQVGPLFLNSGDLIGIAKNEEISVPPDHLIIYPKIVPFGRFVIPSRSPFGTIQHSNPVYEDPSRVMGKRDYQAGDSLRRIDWKATAVTGRLQVKQYEPSIAIETSIFLNMDPNDYDLHRRFDATELAIVVAASVASWTINRKQSAGLCTNGADPLVENLSPQSLPPRKGTAQLMAILDILARVEARAVSPYTLLLHHTIANLPWGTTLILVTGQYHEDLFDTLFEARRMGLNAVIILVGAGTGFNEARRRAEHFGFPLHMVRDERDLEAWK
jgi:uncharacterized protein (DUF58 family)